MLLKAKGKKKCIKCALILTLAGVIAVGAVLSTSQQAMAKPTLPGVEKIILNNSTVNPYVILEILPDKKDAALGYFVAGEEPVDDSGKSLKDMPSKDERVERFKDSTAKAKIGTLGIEDAVSVVELLDEDDNPTGKIYSEPDDATGKRTEEIRGVFTEDSAGDYVETDVNDMYESIEISTINDLHSIDETNTILYRKYMTFFVDKETEDENTNGNETGNNGSKEYTITLSILDDTKKMPISIVDSAHNAYDAYNAQFFVAKELELPTPDDGSDGDDSEGEPDGLPKAGDLIFKVDAVEDGTYTKLSYVGVLESEAQAAMFMARPPKEDKEGLLDEELLDEELLDEEILDGENPDGENPDGENPDGKNSDGENPDGENPDGENPDGENPDGKNPDGENPDGKNLDGKKPDGTNGEGTEPSKDDSNTSDEGQGVQNNNSDSQEGSNIELNLGNENLNDEARALKRAGFFVPTQIGMMYRMSISLSDLTEGAKYVIVKEADGEDTDAEYYYYISEIGEIQDANKEGMIATTSFGEIDRPIGGYEEEASSFLNKTFFINKDDNLPYQYAEEDEDGTHVFSADYTQEVYDSFTYDGGFTNKEWFKRFVFDLDEDKLAEMSIDVVPVTMDELTQEHLDKADMIYFADADGTGFTLPQNNGTSTTPEGDETDTDDVDPYDVMCKSILEKASEGMPVIFDYELYKNTNNDERIRNMAACLLHDDVLEPFGENGLSGKEVSELLLPDLETTMRKPVEGSNTLTYVNGNIFVYDSAKQTAEGDKCSVVSAFFNDKTIFTEEEIDYGFTELIDEIKSENFYLDVAGKDFYIEETVTMATAIRHIINYGDRRNVTKTTLRVLDLEPYDFEDYYPESETPNTYTAYTDIRTSTGTTSVNKIETDSICLVDDAKQDKKLDKKFWIIQNIAPQFENNQNDLSVTIMGTKEFVGKIEDINENYDLIYLGMDTSIMNTTIKDGIKTDDTVYNDSDMDGLVYVHVGDTVYSSVSDGNGAMSGEFRLSGNDITFDKLRELREYIEAGYAVIISDEMVKKDGNSYKVNKEKIDESSNMYTLLKEVVLKTKDDGSYRYFGKNVNVKSAFEKGNDNAAANREIFSRYLGISKLSLEYDKDDLPVMYDERDGKADYLPVDSDGVCRLKFRIKLENDAAVDLTNTTYNCKLYVDIDADGRYSEDEVLSGLRITDGSGSDKYTDDKGKFHLRVGNTYQISRAVPEGYTGFIAWKLVFEQNELEYENVSARALIRSAVEGYSAVPNSGDKPLIKILQIVNEDGKTNLDLKNDDYMKGLYKDSKLDFNIEVSKISSKDYISKTDFKNKSYAQYLKEYDMLVMGFYDVYMIGADKNGKVDDTVVKEAILAIREYALAGHSILFTHDLNSFNIDKNASKTWGKYANQMLRDIQGMDRFGVMSQYGKVDLTKDIYKYASKYDTSKLEKENISDTAKQAMSSPLILNYKSSSTNYGENARNASWDYGLQRKYGGGDISNSIVASLNRGQITEYPYYISENFSITRSHPQYMQLNLDTDSRDENTNDDIVVWYTLDTLSGVKDDYYAAVEMDARNNYFIYNKGNITYTGSGHKEVTSPEEKKLFLNTLVAAYRAGMHAPRVLYKENEWETSATITSKYLPYDPQMVRDTEEKDAEGNPITGGFLEETLPVYFYTTNENLQKTNESLYVEYYIDGTGDEGDVFLDGKPYRRITPSSMERLVEEAGQVTKTKVDNPARLSNNSMHTATFKYADIGLGNTESIKDKYSASIYIRLGYEPLATPKDGTNNVSLPASESISKLNIVCTQLFELR